MSLHPTMRAALAPFAPRDTTVSCTHPECDAEIVVEGYYEAGAPGRLWGPPEKCYPPEPAMFELHKVCIKGVDVTLILAEHVLDAIAEQCIEKCAEAAADALYEARMARRQA